VGKRTFEQREGFAMQFELPPCKSQKIVNQQEAGPSMQQYHQHQHQRQQSESVYSDLLPHGLPFFPSLEELKLQGLGLMVYSPKLKLIQNQEETEICRGEEGLDEYQRAFPAVKSLFLNNLQMTMNVETEKEDSDWQYIFDLSVAYPNLEQLRLFKLCYRHFSVPEDKAKNYKYLIKLLSVPREIMTSGRLAEFLSKAPKNLGINTIISVDALATCIQRTLLPKSSDPYTKEATSSDFE
jgi:hypothetical protein